MPFPFPFPSFSFSCSPGFDVKPQKGKNKRRKYKTKKIAVVDRGNDGSVTSRDTQIKIAKAQLEWERAEFERELAEFVEKKKLRENNIRRNELLLRSLGFSPAENVIRTRK